MYLIKNFLVASLKSFFSSGLILIIYIYFTQYVQNINSLTCNQYEQLMRYFTFSFLVLSSQTSVYFMLIMQFMLY